MGEKPIIFVTYKNERISIKKQLERKPFTVQPNRFFLHTNPYILDVMQQCHCFRCSFFELGLPVMTLWNGKNIIACHIALPWVQRPVNFSIKLLNRCLVTNAFLCKIGIPHPACSLCGESDESLKHIFLSCYYCKNF